MSEELLIGIFSAIAVAIGALWRVHYSDRKEIWSNMSKIESDITKLESRDTVGYRELMATFDEQFSPVKAELQDLTRLVHAIAYKEGIEPDRRKKI